MIIVLLQYKNSLNSLAKHLASINTLDWLENCSKMQTALKILLVIGAAILFAQAQNYNSYYYRPPSCGRCDFNDFKGIQGPPGPKV